MIRHVVLLRLTDPTDAPEAVRRLASLHGQVPSARSIEVGLQVGLEQDPREQLPAAAFHVSLVSTHDDLAALTAYATDPLHEEVLAWLRPRLSDRAVVDAVIEADAGARTAEPPTS